MILFKTPQFKCILIDEMHKARMQIYFINSFTRREMHCSRRRRPLCKACWPSEQPFSARSRHAPTSVRPLHQHMADFIQIVAAPNATEITFGQKTQFGE